MYIVYVLIILNSCILYRFELLIKNYVRFCVFWVFEREIVMFY